MDWKKIVERILDDVEFLFALFIVSIILFFELLFTTSILFFEIIIGSIAQYYEKRSISNTPKKSSTN